MGNNSNHLNTQNITVIVQSVIKTINICLKKIKNRFLKMISRNDKKMLIKEYESRIHPCEYAVKSVTGGYPALYWFCGKYQPHQNALCCMGGDQKLIEITAEQCELKKEEQEKLAQQKQDLKDLFEGGW